MVTFIHIRSSVNWKTYKLRSLDETWLCRFTKEGRKKVTFFRNFSAKWIQNYVLLWPSCIYL